MRIHGFNAYTDVSNARAHAICDRCGFEWNHDRLAWQFDWQGPRLANKRFLVCPNCYDQYQEGLRTIILPPDPLPIRDARPDNYPRANSGSVSTGITSSNNYGAAAKIGVSAQALFSGTAVPGTEIGTMIAGGGVQAAFYGGPNKPLIHSAYVGVSNSSYTNYVGINWGANVSGSFTISPSSVGIHGITHVLSSFTVYAPNDQSFLGSTPINYLVQGSTQDGSTFANWTTLSSGTTAGTNGEVISGSPSGGAYQFHRIAFQGDGINSIGVAQVFFSVSDDGTLL